MAALPANVQRLLDAPAAGAATAWLALLWLWLPLPLPLQLLLVAWIRASRRACA